MMSQAVKQSHYEVLGVSADASPEQIKRAYRAKAKTTHPDKGADQSEFEPIVRAYDVLRNPERRALYDATGQDQRQPIEVEAQSVLMNLFSQALAAKGEVQVVESVRQSVSKTLASVSEQISELTSHKSTLRSRRKKITSKSAINIAHLLIDQEIARLTAQINVLEHQIKVGKHCLKILKDYDEERPQAVFYASPNIYFTTYGDTSTSG